MSPWTLYPPQKKIDKSEVSILKVFFIFVLTTIMVILIRILTWPDGKHVDTVFYIQSVLLSILTGSACMFYYIMLASAANFYHQSKIKFAEWRLYHLSEYARKHLVIAGWSSVTPVDNIALQMLKLEGEFPLAPKTPLRIETQTEFDDTKWHQLFTRLIEPLKEKLIRHSDIGITLWISDEQETATDDLVAVLKKHGVKFSDKINVLSECPDYSFLNAMIKESESYWRYNKLIIIVDMHSEDAKCLDNISALFICKEYQSHEKPRPVYLFQPMTDNIELDEAVPAFLAAGQTAVPKTLWYTGLTKAEKYPLFGALGEHKAAPDRLELELSFGERTAGYRWLALALACDAVMYAQGPLLVAASEKNKPGLTVLASSPPPHVSEPELGEYMPPFLYAILAAFFVCLSSFIWFNVLLSEFNGWLFLLFIILIAAATLAGGFYLSNSVSDKAWEDM
jgi:hypothetical protein